jgi:hypothetical protein
VIVRFDHEAFLSAERLQEILTTFLAMRLPTMKSGMPTIAPTTVQQSSKPITSRTTPHVAVLLRFWGSGKGRGRGGKVLWIGTVTMPLQLGHGAVMLIWS